MPLYEIQPELKGRMLGRVPEAFSDEGKIDLSQLAEYLGLKVLEARFRDPDVSGALKNEDGKWVIYLNEKDSKKRKRFTAAHEIAHYISFLENGKSKQYLDNNNLIIDKAVLLRQPPFGAGSDLKEAELEANALAGEILMPEKTVQYLIDERKLNVEEMADYFQVSESAMTVRLKNLGYVLMEGMTDCA